MTIPRPRSLYDVLNVSPEAEPVVIEAAYKALIKKYHPDQAAETGVLSPDAADLNKAFGVLKDPGRRAEYDHRLWVRDQAIRAAAAPPPPRSRFVGAAGWVAAIMLGGVIAAMAIGREVGTVPALRSASGSSAAASDPPAADAAPPAFLSREQAEADMKAMADVDAERYRRAPLPQPRLRIVEGEEAPYVAPPGPPAPYVAPPPPRRRAPPPAPRRNTREAPAQDAEFLEREGYIY